MKLKIAVFALLLTVSMNGLFAQKYTQTDASSVEKEYKGTTFLGNNTLIENLSKSPNFTIMTKILEKLDGVIAEDAMVTVFVPTDSAFSAFSEEELEALLADTARLRAIVSYHIIPGRLDDHSIKKAITNGSGNASFATQNGEKISVKMADDQVVLVGSDKQMATVSFYDFYHRNGFFHIVNGLVTPSDSK